jgi:hypothetical protein
VVDGVDHFVRINSLQLRLHSKRAKDVSVRRNSGAVMYGYMAGSTVRCIAVQHLEDLVLGYIWTNVRVPERGRALLV